MLKSRSLKLEYFIVIYVLLVSKSLYFETYGENILLLPILILLFLKAYFSKKLIFNKNICIYSLFFLFLVILNLESQLSSVLILIVRLLISILLVGLVSFSVFSNIFSNVILFLGIFSLLSFPIIFYNIPSPFPDFIAIDKRQLRNFIFFGVWNNFIKEGVYRNSGLWWEPGAFSVFLCLAYIFMLINRQLSILKVLTMAIILISTKSSVGIIVFIFITAIYIKQYDFHKKYLGLVLSFIIVVSLVYFIYIYFLPIFFLKINNSDSFISRYCDLVVSINLFKENFILGYGYGSQIQNAIPYGKELFSTYLYESHARPTGSDGITMQIAQLGVFSFILLVPLIFPKYVVDFSLSQKVTISLSIFLLFNTQNFSFLLIYTVLTFYGFLNRNSQ